MEIRREVVMRSSGYKWLSSPVTTYKGPIDAVRGFIPSFDRRAFGPAFLPVEDSENLSKASLIHTLPCINVFNDVIVRNPINAGEVEMPVGIVSKQYTLVQHQEIVDEALAAIRTVGIDPAEVQAELELTWYGERMRLGLLFPQRFNLKLKGEDDMGLRLECFNSVDGSMKFMAVIGWLRFVCLNGMVVGITDSYYRRSHNRYMEMRDIAEILRDGIAATTKEGEIFRSWMKRKISDEKLAKWTDGYLAKKWGVKAAARAWHITKSGRDVNFADPFEKGKPTEKTIIMGNMVPGAVLPGDTVYAVSQSLSWLAKERRDVQEQLEWKRQIPDLLKPLLGMGY